MRGNQLPPRVVARNAEKLAFCLGLGTPSAPALPPQSQAKGEFYFTGCMMAWVKLDDKFTEHPKLINVGPLGIALQVAALCYANTHLTDGFIPYNAARKLLNWDFIAPGSNVIYTIGITSGMSGEDVTWELVAGWLVEENIWEEVEGGYHIHDYQDYQPSKADVLEERSKAQKRMARIRSGEVRANNERSSDAPNPNPNPNESTTTAAYPGHSKVVMELAHWPDIPINWIEYIDKNLAILTLRYPEPALFKQSSIPYSTEYYKRYPARSSVGWLDWLVMEKIPPDKKQPPTQPQRTNGSKPEKNSALKRMIEEANAKEAANGNPI